MGATPYLAAATVADWGDPEGLWWRAMAAFTKVSGWPPFAVGAITRAWRSPFSDILRPPTGSSGVSPDYFSLSNGYL